MCQVVLAIIRFVACRFLPDRLRQLVDPQHTAIVTMELQKGVVGDEGILPALQTAVREERLLEVAGRFCRAARQHGARVVHATMEERPDGAGQAVNCKIFALARSAGPRSATARPTRGSRAWRWSTSSTCSRATSSCRACMA